MKWFGTDGVRGKANELLTPDLALAIGLAHGSWLQQRYENPRVLVARDSRVSGPMLEYAYCSGLHSAGCDTVHGGVLPTPAVAILLDEFSCQGGGMISASHNPVADNGIKLFAEGGHKFHTADIEELEQIMTTQSYQRVAGAEVGRPHLDLAVREAYLARLLSSMDTPLSGLNIGLDCAYGSASTVAQEAFSRLQVEPVILHGEPLGEKINVDCGSTHPESLQQLVVEQGLDMGFAFDGDADRCLAVAEDGRLVDGDLILYILSQSLHQQESPGVVMTVMSNLGVEKALVGQGFSVVRSAVGDRYVRQAMDEQGFVLGGEQSGHILMDWIYPAGDGLLVALTIASYCKKTGRSLSSFLSEVDLYPQKTVNVPVADKKQAMDSPNIQKSVSEWTDKLGGNGRIVLRPSGTESVIRVMVEAHSEEELESCLNDLVQVVAESASS